MDRQGKNTGIMHIVGNRPQFIKLAPLTRALRKRGYRDMIIHTGQHYSNSLSDIFFEELSIGKPYRNLNAGSGTHAEMTGRVLVGAEKVLMEEKPGVAIVYGDTDSTAAAALAAAKLGVPIVHVEAGVRTGLRDNPEEINRVLTDRLSRVLCCPDRQSVENLAGEGITEGVYQTGDIMYDAYLYASAAAAKLPPREGAGQGEPYILMTWHRQENTSTRERMGQILSFLEGVGRRVVCPMHPRTRGSLERFGLAGRAGAIRNLTVTGPVGHMEMARLMGGSSLVLTDSGGLSKEAYFAGVGCLFMLDAVVWPDLYEGGWIKNIDFDDGESVRKAAEECRRLEPARGKERRNYYGDGNTAELIVDILEKERLV